MAVRAKVSAAAVESAAAAAVLAYVTLRQEHRCASLVGLATCSHGLLYALLRSTGLLQPADGLSPIDRAEWRSRILGSLNALILVGGTALCFSEWPYEPAAEGWTGQDRIWSAVPTLASLFVGYLQWDLCWVIWHRRDYRDRTALVHHVVYICVTHFVLSGVYFKRPFAWLSLTELSTPFLNARWFYAASGRRGGRGYLYSSVAFALTFLLTRVVGYTLGMIDLAVSYPVWRAVPGLHGAALGLFMGYALNLFWARGVVLACRRVMRRGVEEGPGRGGGGGKSG